MELRFELDENNQRKNYSTEELFGIQERIRKFLKKRFPVGRRKRNEKRQQVGTLKSLSLDRVDKVIGRMTGESHENVRRRRKIVTAVKSNPNEYGHILESVDKGGLKLKYAAEMIEREELKKKPSPPPPKGQFELIYIDPPWDYDRKLEGSPKYKTMSLEEMKREIKIPAAKNCIMFMWVTNPKYEEGRELLNYWGFTYKSKMTWVKMKNGKLQMTTGYYVRGADEMLLIVTKGNPGVPAEKDKPPSVIFAERTIHSRKPRKVARIIERMYPHKNKIEMFARKKDPDDDETWTYWGDQLNEI